MICGATATRKAFQEYALAAFAAFSVIGEGCTAWDAGTEIFADWEGTFIPANIAEVRKRGSSARWWAFQNMIKGRG